MRKIVPWFSTSKSACLVLVLKGFLANGLGVIGTVHRGMEPPAIALAVVLCLARLSR